MTSPLEQCQTVIIVHSEQMIQRGWTKLFINISLMSGCDVIVVANRPTASSWSKVLSIKYADIITCLDIPKNAMEKKTFFYDIVNFVKDAQNVQGNNQYCFVLACQTGTRVHSL